MARYVVEEERYDIYYEKVSGPFKSKEKDQNGTMEGVMDNDDDRNNECNQQRYQQQPQNYISERNTATTRNSHNHDSQGDHSGINGVTDNTRDYTDPREQGHQRHQQSNNYPPESNYTASHIQTKNSYDETRQYPPETNIAGGHERNKVTQNEDRHYPHESNNTATNRPVHSKYNKVDEDLIDLDSERGGIIAQKYNGISDGGSCIAADNKHDNIRASSQQVSNHDNRNSSNRGIGDNNHNKFGIESIMNRGTNRPTNMGPTSTPPQQQNTPENAHQRESRRSVFTNDHNNNRHNNNINRSYSKDAGPVHQSHYYAGSVISSNNDDDSLVESVKPGRQRSYRRPAQQQHQQQRKQATTDGYRHNQSQGNHSGSSRLNIQQPNTENSCNEIRIDEYSMYDGPSINQEIGGGGKDYQQHSSSRFGDYDDGGGGGKYPPQHSSSRFGEYDDVSGGGAKQPSQSRFGEYDDRGRGSKYPSKAPSFEESSISSPSMVDNNSYYEPDDQSQQGRPNNTKQQSSKLSLPNSQQSTANQTYYNDSYIDDSNQSQSQYTTRKYSISDNNDSNSSTCNNSTINRIIDDLPNGGEWYDFKCHAVNLGVKLYATEQLTQSLYEDVDDAILQILNDRPVIGYMFKNSPLQKAQTKVGDILLAINDIEVATPEDASQLIKEAERPMKLLFYTPDIKLNMNEGFHMVKYDSNSIDAPTSVKNWKPKWVVVGGLIAKAPYIISMYRSKLDYDQAVRDTFARKPISVKIKQFSLLHSTFESNAFSSVYYDNEPRPWLYFVLIPPPDAKKKGNAFQYPIKIASAHEHSLVRIYSAIQRAILKMSNVASHGGSSSTYLSSYYDTGSSYTGNKTSNQDTASSYHDIASGLDPSNVHDYLDDESSYYQQRSSAPDYHHQDSYNSKNNARSVNQDSFYDKNTNARSVAHDSFHAKNTNARSVAQESFYTKNTNARSVAQESFYTKNTDARSVAQESFYTKNTNARSVAQESFYTKNTDARSVAQDSFYTKNTNARSSANHQDSYYSKNNACSVNQDTYYDNQSYADEGDQSLVTDISSNSRQTGMGKFRGFS